MNSLRFMSWPGTGIVGLGLCLLLELAVGFERRWTAQKVEVQLARQRREWRALGKTEPSPTADHAMVIEADLTRVRQNATAWEAEIRSSAEAVAQTPVVVVPTNPTEAFFDLAGFVEAMRLRAAERGVVLQPDERCGFSSYAHVGPESELIKTVFQQRRVLEFLMKALLDARPAQILALQRENPVRPDRAEKVKPRSTLPSRDLFEMPVGLSLRVPGEITTQAFRLSFIGKSAELRAFLNQLARFEFPVVVRFIEVEPATGGESIMRALPARDIVGESSALPVADKPLVQPSASKFTVIVEFIEVEKTTATAADKGATGTT